MRQIKKEERMLYANQINQAKMLIANINIIQTLTNRKYKIPVKIKYSWWRACATLTSSHSKPRHLHVFSAKNNVPSNKITQSSSFRIILLNFYLALSAKSTNAIREINHQANYVNCGHKQYLKTLTNRKHKIPAKIKYSWLKGMCNFALELFKDFGTRMCSVPKTMSQVIKSLSQTLLTSN